jgi:lipoprotein-releasing system ATP-binding protein
MSEAPQNGTAAAASGRASAGNERGSGVPLIEARAVTRILAEVVPTTLVRDVDLTIGANEFVAITGPSGSGKSSLLYLLGLLDVPTAGEVRIRGKATSAMDEDERASTRLATIGFVFQFHFLLPEFSARDNVMLPMRALGTMSLQRMQERADALLAALGLAEHAGKRPDQLSGGQRQRAAVARALANEPPLILTDEPTGSLDSQSSEQVFEILRDLVARHGKTVVAVTHDLGIAARIGRRIRLADGAIVADEGN